jgi:hypothetical protein
VLCGWGHTLRANASALTATAFCDLCRATGTALICSAGCDYDVCQVCFDGPGNLPAATPPPPVWDTRFGSPPKQPAGRKMHQQDDILHMVEVGEVQAAAACTLCGRAVGLAELADHEFACRLAAGVDGGAAYDVLSQGSKLAAGAAGGGRAVHGVVARSDDIFSMDDHGHVDDEVDEAGWAAIERKQGGGLPPPGRKTKGGRKGRRSKGGSASSPSVSPTNSPGRPMATVPPPPPPPRPLALG